MTVYQDEQNVDTVDIAFVEDEAWNDGDTPPDQRFYACDITVGFNPTFRFAPGAPGRRNCARFTAQWLRDLADRVEREAGR